MDYSSYAGVFADPRLALSPKRLLLLSDEVSEENDEQGDHEKVHHDPSDLEPSKQNLSYL